MADFSSAAQAVLGAADSVFDQAGTTKQGLAAALRAAADQVVPEEFPPYVPDFPDSDEITPYYEWLYRRKIRTQLLAIAADLEQLDD